MPAVLAIDQGTTSVRASVLGADLAVVASRAEEVARSFPRPGWVELDASELVAATERVAAAALAAAHLGPRDIVGVGLANQGETVLLWDRATGEPVAPAIVWQCRRTEAICASLRDEGRAAWVPSATGLPVDPYFSATKIAWLLDHVPGARERAKRGELAAGTLDAFTVHRLSGGRHFVTDPSTACRTLLFELGANGFSDRLCDLFDVPRALLPEVVPSDARVGTIRIAGGEAPLMGLLCDQPSALLGTGCLAPGDVKCTYGTGAFLQVNAGHRPPAHGDDGLLRSVAWEIGGRRTYLLEGSVLAAGDVLTWLRDGLGMIASADAVDDVLRRTPDTGGVLFLPALTGLGAPSWVGDARGVVLGLHRGTRREHLIRAALEGIAHQVADVLAVAARVHPGELSPMWADGGLSASAAFLELQADVAGRSLRRAGAGEATTRGVAAIAAVAAGLAPSVEAALAPGGGKAARPSMISPRWGDPERAHARERHAKLSELARSAAVLDLTRGANGG